MAAANGTIVPTFCGATNAQPIAPVIDNTQSGFPVASSTNNAVDYAVNNGARAAHFNQLLRNLWHERGHIDEPQLDLDIDMAQEIGSWDERDIAAARRYFQEIVDTNRRVGQPAKRKAAQLLHELDTLSYQGTLPLKVVDEDGDVSDYFDPNYERAYQRDRDALKTAYGKARAKSNAYDAHEYNPETGERYKYDDPDRPKNIERAAEYALSQTPVLDEIRKWANSGRTKDIAKKVNEALHDVDRAETEFKRYERELKWCEEHHPGDAKWTRESFDKAQVELDERKAALEKIQADFEDATNY